MVWRLGVCDQDFYFGDTMTRFTEEQLLEYMARINPRPEQDDIADPGPESILAGKITAYAKSHGWVGQ